MCDAGAFGMLSLTDLPMGWLYLPDPQFVAQKPDLEL
jgi:hypothetical protein